MKRCRKIQKNMERYLDGELLPEKIRFFEEHLKTCIHCRRVLEQKREERRQRIIGLMPEVVPISTDEILSAVQRLWPSGESDATFTLPPRTVWWEKIKSLAFRPAPAIALALCIIALGMSFFLPFGTQKPREHGIVIEEIESSQSIMIYQPEHTETTLIWIVPSSGKQEAT